LGHAHSDHKLPIPSRSHRDHRIIVQLLVLVDQVVVLVIEIQVEVPTILVADASEDVVAIAAEIDPEILIAIQVEMTSVLVHELESPIDEGDSRNQELGLDLIRKLSSKGDGTYRQERKAQENRDEYARTAFHELLLSDWEVSS